MFSDPAFEEAIKANRDKVEELYRTARKMNQEKYPGQYVNPSQTSQEAYEKAQFYVDWKSGTASAQKAKHELVELATKKIGEALAGLDVSDLFNDKDKFERFFRIIQLVSLMGDEKSTAPYLRAVGGRI